MPNNPLVVGHRGWSGRFPDNTLAGLIAVAAVADMVEIDVRRSGDGKLVLAHDAELVGHEVASTPWAILADCDLGGGHKPALLDEALAAIPGLPAQLEVKNDPGAPGFEPDHRLALEVAERARPPDLVTSFNADTLTRVRSEFPAARTGLVTLFADAADQYIDRCVEDGHRAMVPHHLMVDDRLLELCAGRLQVFPWTVNEPQRAVELARLGVTGIITDFPDQISEALGGL